MNKYHEYKVNWSLSTNKYNIECIYKELFTYIINKQKYNKVVFTGTSAGGFPSLKFACKFNCIALISNSQIYLEKYGSEVNKQGFYHLKYMGESKEDKLIYQDRMIESIIQNNKPNKIIIYNNKKDSTYETHVLPLINYAKNIEIYDLFETYFFEYNNLPEEKNQHKLQFPNDKIHIDILQEYFKNN